MTSSNNFKSEQIIRKRFAKYDPQDIEIPYLLELQTQSYESFLQLKVKPEEREDKGLQKLLKGFFPLHNAEKTATLEFLNYEILPPEYTSHECIESGRTYSAMLKLKLRLIIWDVEQLPEEEKGKREPNREVLSIKEQDIYLCDLPLMSDNGVFVINGIEKVIVSQMRRAPGVFFGSETGKETAAVVYVAKIVPSSGSWMDFEFDVRENLYFRIDRRRKMLITSLLRALGYETQDIIQEFYNISEISFARKAWQMSFDYGTALGKRFSYNLVDARNNEVVIKKNTKITRRLLEQLEKNGFKDFVITRDMLWGYVFAEDIVDKSGAKIVDLGSPVSMENLEALQKIDYKKLRVFNPNTSKVGTYIFNSLCNDKNTSKEEALYEIYKNVRMGEIPASMEMAENYFNNLFFSDRYNLQEVGRIKMNYRLGLNVDLNILHLTKEDIVETVRTLCNIKYTESNTDDIDNLANRRIRAVGELVEQQFRVGLARIERSIVERMNNSDVDSVMPQSLINAKPLISAVKDFFATSQLSQFMDQTNPLSEVVHKRKLSALGPGGLTRERAGFEVRDIHPTHYGRICPIETPESVNVGLILSLASYAKVNKYGFIETPYRKVENGKATNKIVYLSALEEGKSAIVQAATKLNKDGSFVDDLVLCRQGDEIVMLPSESIDYMDVAPNQAVSISASLIPFVENDEAKRALMGSNMMRQAVPLLQSEAPFVGTGVEAKVARDSGCMLRAEHNGVVKFADAERIVIETEADESGIPDVDIYRLRKFKRTNMDTVINQKPLVNKGDVVQKGDFISDAQSIDRGDLAVGRNVLVAFMCWNGYSFEDSVVVSERLVHDDVFTSIHIEEFELIARDTRLGPEEITRDIPNISDETLKKLDETGIIHIGAEVQSGDILVGKTTPKGESPVTPEEKLLKVIFGEKANDVKDSSLYLPPGVKQGTVVDVKVMSRQGIDRDERSLYIEMQEAEHLLTEKKMRLNIVGNRYRSEVIKLVEGQEILKGVEGVKKGAKLSADLLSSMKASVMASIEVADKGIMEKLAALHEKFEARHKVIDKIFEEKIRKLREGDELPQGVLKVVKVYIAIKYHIQPGDKVCGRHGNKGVVSKVLPVEDMPYLEDGTPIDLILNPLSAMARMNIGQVLETHLGWASVELGKQIGEMIKAVQINRTAKMEELRQKLLTIFDSEDRREYKMIEAMDDDELLAFAKENEGGIHFATGLFENIDIKEIENYMEMAGLDKTGQVYLYDGQTGERFDRKITVGYNYILKLYHLADSKIHARSIGPYSLITQQPLGGKSHFGGQRFGEMECWALQAYGAAYTLQEMLTVKSDDVVGRIKIYESIIQDTQNFTCGVPESFNVMIKEVRSLGLNIELTNEEQDKDKEA